MKKYANGSTYERAKWFLRRRGLDKLAEVPELLLAMNEYAEEVKRSAADRPNR